MTRLRIFVCLMIVALLAQAHGAEPSPAEKESAAELVDTMVESGAAEMVSTEKETTFTFTERVKVTATNMTLTCDKLVVVARRTGDPEATIGQQQNFKSLIATGNVRIVQSDREATAERAEVFPDDDKVILSGNPVVQSVKEGWKQSGPGMQLVLHRGERRAVLEGPEGTRARLILPPLKDLGYEKEKEKKAKSAPPKDANAPQESAPANPEITVPLPKSKK